MEQKIIWMRYLIIGISLTLANGCGTEEVDYNVKARFIYINETKHEIECISSSSFNIESDGQHIIDQEGTGGKTITHEDYVPPFLSAIIIYDDVKCDTLDSGTKAGQGEGAAGIQNYEYEKLAKRYYKFTYRFTEEQFEQAKECE